MATLQPSLPEREAAEPPAAREKLPLRTKLLFGLPSFPGAALAIPIAVNMPKFYSDVVLVPLGWIAIAIALARALDAVTDPMMGWLSDRTKSRWGRRRPWIALGVPFAAIALVALFTPPAGMTDIQAAFWFGGAFILYFVFHTVYDMPHYGLGAELTLDYNERSSLFGIRALFILPGTLAGVVIPGLLIQTGADQREAFFITSALFAVLLVVTYAMMVWGLREREDFATRESNPLVPGVRRSMRNRPFRILLFAYAIGSIPGAIPGTMLPFFAAYVIQAESAMWLPIFLGTYFMSGFLALGFWMVLAQRFGKLPVWLASYVIGITGGFAGFLVGPGDELLFTAILFYTGLQFSAGFFLGPAMQADVVDYDELHTGKRREAQYGSFWAIATKLVVIPSAAVPLAVMGAMGYVPNQEQTPEVVMTIRFIFCFAPAFFSALSFVLAMRYPISKKIHEGVQEGIHNHGNGRSATDPLTGDEIAPPGGGDVDEATGWRLDYFAPRELARIVLAGPDSVLGVVVAKLALWTATTLATSYLAYAWIAGRGADLSDVENMLLTLLVVGAGTSLAATLYHATRIAPAIGLRHDPVPVEVVERHLAKLR